MLLFFCFLFSVIYLALCVNRRNLLASLRAAEDFIFFQPMLQSRRSSLGSLEGQHHRWHPYKLSLHLGRDQNALDVGVASVCVKLLEKINPDNVDAVLDEDKDTARLQIVNKKMVLKELEFWRAVKHHLLGASSRRPPSGGNSDKTEFAALLSRRSKNSYGTASSVVRTLELVFGRNMFRRRSEEFPEGAPAKARALMLVPGSVNSRRKSTNMHDFLSKKQVKSATLPTSRERAPVCLSVSLPV